MAKKAVQAAAGDRARIEIEFDKPQLLGRIFGEFDENLVAIENRLGVYIAARGNRLQIEGEASACARAREVLEGLYSRLLRGEDIDSGMVEAIIAMTGTAPLKGIVRNDAAEPPQVVIRTRKKTIVPRSAGQVPYMQALLAEQSQAFNAASVGKTCAIMLERTGRKPGQLIGKSPWLQSVHLDGTGLAIGDLVEVELVSAGPNSLAGRELRKVAA